MTKVEKKELLDLTVANNLNHVHSILKQFTVTGETSLSIERLANALEITPRQIYYYVDAGKHLADLFEVHRSVVYLKSNGTYFTSRLSLLEPYLIKNLLSYNLIQKLVNVKNLTKLMILRELELNEDWKNRYSQASLERRASSLLSWVKRIHDYKKSIPVIEDNNKVEKKLLNQVKSLVVV